MCPNPARISSKTLLARKEMGNHLIKSTPLEKFKALSLVSAVLVIECATQFLWFDILHAFLLAE